MQMHNALHMGLDGNNDGKSSTSNARVGGPIGQCNMIRDIVASNNGRCWQQIGFNQSTVQLYQAVNLPGMVWLQQHDPSKIRRFDKEGWRVGVTGRYR